MPRISPGGSRYPFEAAVDRARLLDESRHAASGSARVDVDLPGHLVVRVEQDFLGCVADGGTHRVELRFMPRSFVHGSIVSSLGLVLLRAGLVVMSCGSSQHRYRTTTQCAEMAVCTLLEAL